jgi:hypothetical protein
VTPSKEDTSFSVPHSVAKELTTPGSVRMSHTNCSCWIPYASYMPSLWL